MEVLLRINLELGCNFRESLQLSPKRRHISRCWCLCGKRKHVGDIPCHCSATHNNTCLSGGCSNRRNAPHSQNVRPCVYPSCAR